MNSHHAEITEVVKREEKAKSISKQQVQRSMVCHAFIPLIVVTGHSFAIALGALLYKCWPFGQLILLSSSAYLIFLAVMSTWGVAENPSIYWPGTRLFIQGGPVVYEFHALCGLGILPGSGHCKICF